MINDFGGVSEFHRDKKIKEPLGHYTIKNVTSGYPAQRKDKP